MTLRDTWPSEIYGSIIEVRAFVQHAAGVSTLAMDPSPHRAMLSGSVGLQQWLFTIGITMGH